MKNMEQACDYLEINSWPLGIEELFVSWLLFIILAKEIALHFMKPLFYFQSCYSHSFRILTSSVSCS